MRNHTGDSRAKGDSGALRNMPSRNGASEAAKSEQRTGTNLRTDGGTPVRDDGYDDWLDALAAGSGYYLSAPDGPGLLPPRRVCPETGSTDLNREPLPAVGAVETFTVVHVPPPRFADDAPYVTAIADFGSVRLTGVLRGVEPADDAIPIGLEIEVGVETRATDDERVVAFRPV